MRGFVFLEYVLKSHLRVQTGHRFQVVFET